MLLCSGLWVSCLLSTFLKFPDIPQRALKEKIQITILIFKKTSAETSEQVRTRKQLRDGTVLPLQMWKLIPKETRAETIRAGAAVRKMRFVARSEFMSWSTLAGSTVNTFLPSLCRAESRGDGMRTEWGMRGILHRVSAPYTLDTVTIMMVTVLHLDGRGEFLLLQGVITLKMTAGQAEPLNGALPH